jgi:hypothetical protein
MQVTDPTAGWNNAMPRSTITHLNNRHKSAQISKRTTTPTAADSASFVQRTERTAGVQRQRAGRKTKQKWSV